MNERRNAVESMPALGRVLYMAEAQEEVVVVLGRVLYEVVVEEEEERTWAG
jgi:hypothetical protein